MQITPKLVASLIKGKVEGNADVEITGFSSIEDAKEGCITFVANPKYEQYIYGTKASVVIVRDDFQPTEPVSATLIRVADPYSCIAELLAFYESQKSRPTGVEEPCHISEGVEVPEGAYIGAFSYIGKGCVLGKDVKIYPQAYVGEGVTVGEGTVIYPGAKIYHGCAIGRNCIIHAGAVIGADGFGFAPKDGGYEKIPQIGNVVIEDNVEIGANTTVDRATFGSTRIGAGTKLDNLIQVGHNVELGNSNVMSAQSGIAGSTHIGSHNMIGGQVGISGHIRIGDYNQIGAQSGVPNNVGDRNRLLGYPAIDARQFAKNLVYVKKLEQIYNALKDKI